MKQPRHRPFRVGRFWYVRIAGINFQPFLTRREARAFARMLATTDRRLWCEEGL